MPQLHVKISLLYYFKAYMCIWQTSLKDWEWQANIHGDEEHEVGGDWECGGLLWEDSKVGSWFTSTNQRQFFDYYV